MLLLIHLVTTSTKAKLQNSGDELGGYFGGIVGLQLSDDGDTARLTPVERLDNSIPNDAFFEHRKMKVLCVMMYYTLHKSIFYPIAGFVASLSIR